MVSIRLLLPSSYLGCGTSITDARYATFLTAASQWFNMNIMTGREGRDPDAVRVATARDQ